MAKTIKKPKLRIPLPVQVSEPMGKDKLHERRSDRRTVKQYLRHPEHLDDYKMEVICCGQ